MPWSDPLIFCIRYFRYQNAWHQNLIVLERAVWIFLTGINPNARVSKNSIFRMHVLKTVLYGKRAIFYGLGNICSSSFY